MLSSLLGILNFLIKSTRYSASSGLARPLIADIVIYNLSIIRSDAIAFTAVLRNQEIASLCCLLGFFFWQDLIFLQEENALMWYLSHVRTLSWLYVQIFSNIVLICHAQI